MSRQLRPIAVLLVATLAICPIAPVAAQAGQPNPANAGNAPAPAGTPNAQPAPAASRDPAFDILAFDVEGNSVLSKREIELAVTPYLGLKRHFADIEAARRALENAYQKAGFQTAFVDIPEQRISGGVIRLHVLEGSVGRLHVTGSRYYEQGQIRAAVPQLAPGSVPDFLQMQQEMTDLNRSADRQVSPILSPGRVPGTVDVNLSVKDSLPLHGEIEDDNHASPFTTGNRTSASLHYDNLWQRQHSIAVNYQVAPQDPAQTNVLYATYLWRFSGSDDVVSVYGIRSNSNVAVVGGSTILGNAKIAGARWIMPLSTTSTPGFPYFHSITLGIDRKDFGQTNINAALSSLTVLPPVVYVPLSLTYAATALLPSRTVSASFGFVTAPRDVLGNSDTTFQSRRVYGGASYVAYKYEGSIDETLSKHWGAYVHAVGQWSFDPLIPNEQFLTGGADSVRGYRESEVSGDRGINATLEARLFPFGHPGPDGNRSLYACAFVDGAQVRLVHPAGPQISIATIASTGVGVHAQSWYGFRLALDVAKTLRDGGHGVSSFITPNGTTRVEALLGYSF